MSSAQSEVNKLLREAKRRGCVVDSSSKHHKVKMPDGSLVIVSRTPSDYRALLKIRKRLEKV